MPEWMMLWGQVLFFIILTGVTVTIIGAVVYAAFTSLKDWIEERRYKRRAEERREKRREGKRVSG